VRVILVNPFDETVKEAIYGGDFREIYDLIECRTFTVQMIDEDNDLYLDDEGDSKATTLDLWEASSMVGFKPKGYSQEPYMEFSILS